MRKILIPLFSLALFAACGSDESEPVVDVADKKSPAPVEKKPTSKGSGYLRLGDEEFEFDVVVCTGTTMATAVASDSQKRPNYPVITIRTYDESMTGGTDTNTASAVFNDGDVRQHWKRYQGGNVSRREGSFSANGFLEGSKMIEQDDGTLKSASMGEDGVRAFIMRIKCRGMG